MGRQFTCGTVEWVAREGTAGYWRCAVVFPKSATRRKRERHWFRLDAVKSEAEARVRARELHALAKAGHLQPPALALPTAKARPWDEIPDETPGGQETVKGWSKRWSAERLRRGWKSTRADDARLHTWIWPRLGALPIVGVTRAQIEAFSEWLDEQVLEEAMSWKTALNVWSLLSKLFHDAAHGKPRWLRVRTEQGDPSEKVAPPDRGTRKGKQFLYPSESDRLLRCDAVPLEARQAFAVAIYQYPRAGELQALDCDDVDLVHGTLKIHRAVHADSGEVRETKGNRPRRVPIHPELYPLLVHLVRMAGGKGPLWPDWPLWKDRAGQLRKYLLRAGVDRAELHEGSDTSKVLGFHDLRATGITWEAIVGTDAPKIQQRAGHTTMGTTLIYVRLADEVRGVRFGVPFSPLPACLLGAFGSSFDTRGDSKGAPMSEENRLNSRVRGEGFEPNEYVSKRSETERIPQEGPPSVPAGTHPAAPESRPGLNAGSNPDGGLTAVRAAVHAALDGGDDGLAAELLEVLRRRGALPGAPGVAKVVDLNDRRAARKGEPK